MTSAADHIRNRNAYPRDKLVPYAGKCVAWSEDGTEILASADDMGLLIDAMDARYPVGTEFIMSFIEAESRVDTAPPSDGMLAGPSANGANP